MADELDDVTKAKLHGVADELRSAADVAFERTFRDIAWTRIKAVQDAGGAPLTVAAIRDIMVDAYFDAVAASAHPRMIVERNTLNGRLDVFIPVDAVEVLLQ